MWFIFNQSTKNKIEKLWIFVCLGPTAFRGFVRIRVLQETDRQANVIIIKTTCKILIYILAYFIDK